MTLRYEMPGNGDREKDISEPRELVDDDVNFLSSVLSSVKSSATSGL